jgi:putative phosphoesterase
LQAIQLSLQNYNSVCLKLIGLISDTHGHLDPKVFKYFDKVDEIWHAGDVGNFEVIEKLKEFKPFKGVYGNIDGQRVRAEFPENLRFICEGLDVWITHIGGYPNRYDNRVRAQIFENPPQLFITGHSHILKVMWDKKLNLLHLNPGAAGISGFHQVKTLMRFAINKGKVENLEVIELGPKARKLS